MGGVECASWERRVKGWVRESEQSDSMKQEILGNSKSRSEGVGQEVAFWEPAAITARRS